MSDVRKPVRSNRRKPGQAPAPVEPAAVTTAVSAAALATADVVAEVARTAVETTEAVEMSPTPVSHSDDTQDAAPVAAPASPAIERESIMNDTVNKFADTAKQATDETVARAQAGAAEFNEHAKGAMERGQRFVEEMNDFSKGNLEALVESSKAAARHAEAFGQHAVELGRKNYEQASAAVQQLASVKSPTDFFRLQSDYARQAFDQMVSEASRNSELALKAAGEVFQPLSNRVAVAAEKVKVSA